MIEKLEVMDVITKPLIYSVIKDLRIPKGGHGLDIGFGIGIQTKLLSERAGLGSKVTGIDIIPELLEYTKIKFEQSITSDQIVFKLGDANQLPFKDSSFDWVWSSNCVGLSSNIDPLVALAEILRVLKPGGSVFLIAWSSSKLLPGYPILEARLNATSSGIAPFKINIKPELHFLHVLNWFHRYSLKDLKVRTFTHEVFTPLNINVYKAMVLLLEMRWNNVKSEISSNDFLKYQRLCLPDSPKFILNSKGYYAFFTYSAFSAKKSATKH